MQTLTQRLDSLLSVLPTWGTLLIYMCVLALMAFLAVKKKWLTASGTAAAVVLGLVILWMGGFSAFLVLLFFFISSSVVSRVSKAQRGVEKKGNCRDAVQVLANGLPAALAILLSRSVVFGPAATVAFVAALSEATADTWSGSFGMLSRKDPVSIITFTKVPKGISGGVSALGFLGGLSASLLTSALGAGCFAYSVSSFSVAAGSGFLGSVIDSLLGALVQVQYRDKEGRLTEKDEENGEKNERVRGIPGFDNDAVNLVSGLLSASLALFLATVIC
ncbi:MAG: DUF92 domain-containing protein [Candidatus Ornithospirochaeta sp.]